MKKPVIKCPRCGGNNTREWSVGVGINVPDYVHGIHMFDDEFYAEMRKQFGSNTDAEDYYCAQNICDDCQCHFATKNRIKVEVLSTEVFKDYRA